MSRVGAAWQRILRGTVWEPGALDDTPPEYRSIFRFWLPLVDIIFMWFGFVGVVNGIESVQRALTPAGQMTWSAVIGLSATAALVGISRPTWWLIELTGKTILIGFASFYVALWAGRGLADPGITATAGVYLLFIFLPMWRAVNLGSQVWQRFWARRRRRRKAAEQ